jgi:hypothetical protein
MAKAGDDSITKILAADAVRLVADAFGYSTARAERDLQAWLAAGRIRWWGVPRGQKLDSDPGEGDPDFWIRRSSADYVQARLSESGAMRTTGAGRLVARAGERTYRPAQRKYGFVLIELCREDVIAALPVTARARLGAAAGKLLARVGKAAVDKAASLKNLGGSPGHGTGRIWRPSCPTSLKATHSKTSRLSRNGVRTTSGVPMGSRRRRIPT